MLMAFLLLPEAPVQGSLPSGIITNLVLKFLSYGIPFHICLQAKPRPHPQEFRVNPPVNARALSRYSIPS